MEYIKSSANSKIKGVAALKSASGRRAEGAFFAEGARIVKDSPFLPREVYVTEELLAEAQKFLDICPVYTVSREAFEKMSDTRSPQGILAVYGLPDTAVKAPCENCAIVLDGLADPGNVGTVIRTAAACGFRDVYAVNSADCFSPKVVRSSMGGIFRIRLHEGTADEVFAALKDGGCSVFTLDMGGKSLFEYKPPMPLALVVGGEAFGVSEFFRKNADGSLSLPMKGDTESLNAAVSAGIAMYLLNFEFNFK